MGLEKFYNYFAGKCATLIMLNSKKPAFGINRHIHKIQWYQNLTNTIELTFNSHLKKFTTYERLPLEIFEVPQ